MPNAVMLRTNRINGIRRHLLVDVSALILFVVVRMAHAQKRSGVKCVLPKASQADMSRLQVVPADEGDGDAKTSEPKILPASVFETSKRLTLPQNPPTWGLENDASKKNNARKYQPTNLGFRRNVIIQNNVAAVTA